MPQLRNWWIPELRLIDAEPNRRAVFEAASRRVIPFEVVLYFSFGCLVFFLVMPRLRGSLIAHLAEAGVVVAYFLVCQGTIMLLTRGRMRRHVRGIMADAGVPICRDCGYDLTGNVSGQCPECGTKLRLAGD